MCLCHMVWATSEGIGTPWNWCYRLLRADIVGMGTEIVS